MSNDVKVTRVSRDSGAMLGPLWVMGWLFTIGYLKLSFWKGVLAIVLWPYDLGAFFHK